MREKVRPIYDILITDILMETPEDVIAWSLNWFHSKSNLNLKYFERIGI